MLAAALVEIAAAHALISTSPSPDLLAALRLAWHRDQLADRNAHIPVQLPAVWVTLGQPVRAEALARSIPHRNRQAQTLADVANSVAEPVRARSCIAGALAAGRWTIPLQALTIVDMAALSAFAGELAALQSPSRTSDNGLLSGTSGHDIRRGPGNGRPAVRDSDTLSGTSVEEEQRRQRKQARRYPWSKRRSNWGPVHDNPDGLAHPRQRNTRHAAGRSPGDHSWRFCALEAAPRGAEARGRIRRYGWYGAWRVIPLVAVLSVTQWRDWRSGCGE
jgi:hypothetical protein